MGAAAMLSTEQNHDAMTASEVQAKSLPTVENNPSKLRWYQPTPGRLLVVLLAVEGGLLFSERWFPTGWSVLIAVAAVGLFLLLMLFWYVLAFIFQWRFQFSIRSLLLLTIAVAFPSSWLAVEMKWEKEQERAAETLVKVHGVLYCENQFYYDSSGNQIEGGPVWLRKVLGDHFFCKVYSVGFLS